MKNLKLTAELNDQVSKGLDSIAKKIVGMSDKVKAEGNKQAAATRSVSDRTLQIQKQAALAEAALVQNRFDRMLSIQRVRHQQLLAGVQNNQASVLAAERLNAAKIAKIRMDQKSFPDTPFQKLLGHLDKVTGQMGIQIPASVQKATSSFAGAGAQAGFMTAGLLGVGAAVTALGTASIFAYTQAREQLDADNKLNAVLRATGEAAGLSFAELSKMAGAMQEVTDFSDDAAQGAQAVLLRFDAIGKDIFPQALKASADLAAHTGNLAGAAGDLGQALQKPEEAARKLKAMDILLSDAQKKQIELFVESGDKAKAQGMILDIVASKYGGNAEAMSHATTKLRNHIGELAEKIGGPLVTAVDKTAEALLGMMKSFSEPRAANGFYTAQLMGLDAVYLKAKLTEEAVAKAAAPAAAAASKAEAPLTDDQDEKLKAMELDFQRAKIALIEDSAAKAIATEKLRYQEEIKALGTFQKAKELAAKTHAQNLLKIQADETQNLSNQRDQQETQESAKRAAREMAIQTKIRDAHKKEAAEALAADIKKTDLIYKARGRVEDIAVAEDPVAKIKLQHQRELLEYQTHGVNVAALEKAQAVEVAEVVAETEKKKSEDRMKSAQDSLAATAGMFSGFAALAATANMKDRGNRLRHKALMIAEAGANTALAATKALSAAPPPFNYALMAGVVAAGIAQVINIKNQKYAQGTHSAPGGMALVGEQGPEMVYLPRGSQVKTARETREIRGSGVVHSGDVVIQIQASPGMSQSEARELGAQAARGYVDRLKEWKKMERDAAHLGVSG